MEPRLYSCWTDDGINPGGLEDFCHGYKTRPTAIHSTSKGKEKCVVMPSLLETAQKVSYELLWGRFRCQEKQKMLVIYLAFYCSVPPGLYGSPNDTLSPRLPAEPKSTFWRGVASHRDKGTGSHLCALETSSLQLLTQMTGLDPGSVEISGARSLHARESIKWEGKINCLSWMDCFQTEQGRQIIQKHSPIKVGLQESGREEQI